MTTTTCVVLDQATLDDMRQVAEWAIVRTSYEFLTEAGGIDPEAIVQMRTRADLCGHLAETGWPQWDRVYGPRGEDDLATLRELAEEEVRQRRMDGDERTGKTDERDRAVLSWARSRTEVAERVLVWLDREVVTS